MAMSTNNDMVLFIKVERASPAGVKEPEPSALVSHALEVQPRYISGPNLRMSSSRITRALLP